MFAGFIAVVVLLIIVGVMSLDSDSSAGVDQAKVMSLYSEINKIVDKVTIYRMLSAAEIKDPSIDNISIEAGLEGLANGEMGINTIAIAIGIDVVKKPNP